MPDSLTTTSRTTIDDQINTKFSSGDFFAEVIFVYSKRIGSRRNVSSVTVAVKKRVACSTLGAKFEERKI